MGNNNYQIAAGGLKMIRTSMILSVIVVIGTFLTAGAALGLMGASLAGSGGAALGAAGIGMVLLLGIAVLSIVSMVMQLMGLGKTTGAHGGYKTAMMLVVVNLIVAVVGAFFKSSNAVLYNLSTIATTILGFLVVYFVISATVDLLREKSDEETASRGATVRSIYLVCTVVNLATLLVNILPALAGIALIALGVSAVAQLVAFFMYIGFLGRSVTSLNA